MKYDLRRSLRSTSGQLVTLALIAASIPVGVFLVQTALKYQTKAVSEIVLLYVSPASQQLPPASTFQIMADVKTNTVGFVRVAFTFDQTQIQLNQEIALTDIFKTVVEKTSMAEANATGVGVIVVALSTSDSENPPTGIFPVASASFVPVTTTTNQPASITIQLAESQVVDMTSNVLPLAKQDSDLTLNPNASELTSTTPLTQSPTNFLNPTLALSSTPSPTPLIQTSNVLEAENMSFGTSAISILSDSSASNGKVLAYYSNASATGNIITPNSTTQLVVTTKGESCKGGAKIEVSLDGVLVLKNKTVNGNAYTNYTATVNKSAGSHAISVNFTNDYTGSNCDRNLRVDKVTLQ
jgi:hypothetical protein